MKISWEMIFLNFHQNFLSSDDHKKILKKNFFLNFRNSMSLNRDKYQSTDGGLLIARLPTVEDKIFLKMAKRHSIENYHSSGILPLLRVKSSRTW